MTYSYITVPNDARAACEIVSVIGLEGTGHHGLGPVLTSMLNFAENKQRVIRRSLIKSASANYTEIFSQYAASCKNKKVSCISVGGGSFPNSRSPFTTKLKSQMRWNPENEKHWRFLMEVGHPIQIEKFYLAAHQFCAVKFILLHRNFVDTNWSHKTWDTGIRGHSRVLGMFAEYIDKNLQKLPTNVWKRIDYEDFWSNKREVVLSDLSKFLNWKVSNVTAAFLKSGFRLVSTDSRVPCSTVRFLEAQELSIFGSLLQYSSESQHLGYKKKLATYANDSHKVNPRCYAGAF